MKLAGDTKTKKRLLRIAIIAASAAVAVAVVVIALSSAIKPPSPNIPQPPENNGNDNPGNPNNSNNTNNPGGDDDDDNFVIDEGVEINMDQFTMLICGTDDDDYHTDTIMLLSFNKKTKKANILSIPRDTIIDTQARQGPSKKINAAYSINKRQNIELTKQDVKSILGFTPDYYMVLDLNGFEQIVDVLGGIEYELTRDYKYWDPDQDLNIDLKAGQQHLDGEKLLWMFRFRYGYKNGDIDRIAVQQDLLSEMKRQMMVFKNIRNIPKALKIANESFNTDMPYGELAWLANEIRKMNGDDFQFFTLPGYGADVSFGTGNRVDKVSYYFLYKARTLEMINAYFNPFEKDITNIGVVPYGEYAAYNDAAIAQIKNNANGGGNNSTSNSANSGNSNHSGNGGGGAPDGGGDDDQGGSGGDDGESGDQPVYTGDPAAPAFDPAEN